MVALRVTGTERIGRKARQIQKLSEDPTGVVAPFVAEALFESYQRGFADAQAPTGASWAPRKQPAGHPLGIRSGDLANPRVVRRRLGPGWSLVVRAVPRYAIFFHRRRATVPIGEALGTWERPVRHAIDEGIERLVRRVTG